MIAFNLYRIVVFCSLLLVFQNSSGNVRLPKLISDGMVLQRNANIKIWGWADTDEKITVHFIDKTYNTIADKEGKWSVILSSLKPGGPFRLEISAKNNISLNDILVGDVWLCSGQSNMELPMERVKPIYESEIANSENNHIRQFVVPQKYNFKTPQQDLEQGKWQAANPQSILRFSAVAYFFAKEIFEKYKVPIGIINASLGGSPIESWMSEEALLKFPEYHSEAIRFRDETLIKKIENEDKTRINDWYIRLRANDEGYKDSQNPWFKPNLNTTGWSVMNVPGYWQKEELGHVNGVVWFRKNFEIPATMTGKPAKLTLGRIVDADSVFVNGVFAGTTSYQYPPRRYTLPANLLKEGNNTIVVRIINNSGYGGFVENKPYEIEAGGEKIDLKGEWHYKLGAKMDPMQGQTFIRWKPLGLYNGMISPLLNFSIKGILWYQGESNATKPTEYEGLLKTMIIDWRAKWGQNNLPFLYVQLPNFMNSKENPSESNWALFREVQLKTLAVPNTGMAITIDVGEANDIHPLNKKDVGVRLALAAQKIAYGEKKIVHSGPLYQSMKIEGNKVILSFNNTGSGLIAKGGDLKHFAVAGNDKQFVWAKAIIEKNKVIVWSDKVINPVMIRYAWADNPEGANLYNKEGLPASPFQASME